MNAHELLKDLQGQDVRLEADGERLLINAPPGGVTREVRDALCRHKAQLLALLRADSVPDEVGERGERCDTTEGTRAELTDGRRFDARLSRHSGYTSLYDPVRGEWHDFPTRDCYPSVIELAHRRKKRSAATGKPATERSLNDPT
jgi:hypothetical protein